MIPFNWLMFDKYELLYDNESTCLLFGLYKGIIYDRYSIANI